MSSDVVTVKYDGIEIVYHETENIWRFELRGRERRVESLAKAKEAIDKPPAKDEKKPFTRMKAYLNDYGDKFSTVEVTSIAEVVRWRNSVDVWIVKDGSRSKKDSDYLYAITPQNDAAIGQWKKLGKDVEELENKRLQIVAGMKKIDVSAA